MYEDSYKRWGELTPLGAEQHRQIARRMYERFPSVFADSVWVDAKSTVVIRCILSMENELLELLRHNPRLRILHDGSKYTTRILQKPEKSESRLGGEGIAKRGISYDAITCHLYTFLL